MHTCAGTPRCTCRTRFPGFFMYSNGLALHPVKGPVAPTATGVARQAASQTVLRYRVGSSYTCEWRRCRTTLCNYYRFGGSKVESRPQLSAPRCSCECECEFSRPENLLANFSHEISKKNCELSVAKEFASEREWFANEIAKISSSPLKFLANGSL